MARRVTLVGNGQKEEVLGTFSIVGRCPRTGALGVCVSTAVPAVGSVVPHAEAGVGAIATQGFTNIHYGIDGLSLLMKGLSSQIALETMLRKDSERELRQVAIIDAQGRTAAFTGKETHSWRGHVIRENCIAAGNTVASGEVIEAMVEVFEDCVGWLAERLMKSLEAGQEAGGDRRGKASAALLVVDKKLVIESRPSLDLRVDLHAEPVMELRTILERYKKWAGINR